jgi:very-short-patch-repair endonuclease
VKIHNYKILETKRKALRSNGTAAEATLWKSLQRRQLLGRKFRRQHSVLYFIVDFYCPQELLIIELDGAYHNNPEQREYDLKRTKILEQLGFKLIRFENKMVYEHLEFVLNDIKSHFKD